MFACGYWFLCFFWRLTHVVSTVEKLHTEHLLTKRNGFTISIMFISHVVCLGLRCFVLCHCFLVLYLFISRLLFGFLIFFCFYKHFFATIHFIMFISHIVRFALSCCLLLFSCSLLVNFLHCCLDFRFFCFFKHFFYNNTFVS